MNTKVQESKEDYLEAILVLTKKNGQVRAVDLCNYFNYSRPTISQTLKSFKEDNLVSVSNTNLITLTEKGEEIAKRVFERHETLTVFFEKLGVSKETAIEDACKLEHDLSEESYQKIKEFLAK